MKSRKSIVIGVVLGFCIFLAIAAFPPTWNSSQFQNVGGIFSHTNNGNLGTNKFIYGTLNLTNSPGFLVSLNGNAAATHSYDFKNDDLVKFSLVSSGGTEFSIQNGALIYGLKIFNSDMRVEFLTGITNKGYLTNVGNIYGLNSIFATNFNGYTATTNIIVRKNADQTLDSTTVNDDTELQFALAANEKANFNLRAKFVAGSVAGDGLKVTMTNTAASGTYGLWFSRIIIAAGTVGLSASQTTFGTTGADATIDADTSVEINGFVQQGSASGTIKFQWAKNADAGTAHTCKSNAVMNVTKF